MNTEYAKQMLEKIFTALGETEKSKIESMWKNAEVNRLRGSFRNMKKWDKVFNLCNNALYCMRVIEADNAC